jgi:hypothetical protein
MAVNDATRVMIQIVDSLLIVNEYRSMFIVQATSHRMKEGGGAGGEAFSAMSNIFEDG